MSLIFAQVENFLLKFCPSSAPLLLALSGGPDSLCLFYALLFFRERCGLSFHIAHVDHRWRSESQEEAEILRQLALHHQVPFHLKVLDPHLLKRNLEAACREERYTFFAQLCEQFSFQAVLTAHHQDDQAETIFKRLLEGAHWSRWMGLQSESWIKNVRILRPLLQITKNEINAALSQKHIQAFEDASNWNLKFLRARLRETIFPRLNQEFGKQVQNNLIAIGKETQELIDYFDTHLAPILQHLIQGPWGIYLDLQTLMPKTLLEIKYLLRLLCKDRNFFLSREIIAQAAQTLQLGKANQLFAMGSHQVWIDRQRIFMMPSALDIKESQLLPLSVGDYVLGDWKLTVREDLYFPIHPTPSWKEGWKGKLKTYLPKGNYEIGFKKFNQEQMNIKKIKKQWNQAKVPAFLYPYFPLVWKDREVFHEFLTGKSLFSLKEGKPCWKVELYYK